MTTELSHAPCPHCGDTNVYLLEPNEWGKMAACCNSCAAQGGWGKSAGEAWRWWDMRAARGRVRARFRRPAPKEFDLAAFHRQVETRGPERVVHGDGVVTYWGHDGFVFDNRDGPALALEDERVALLTSKGFRVAILGCMSVSWTIGG